MFFEQQFLPIFLLVVFSFILASLPIFTSCLINRIVNKKNPQKKLIALSEDAQNEPYECGNPTFSEARIKVPIKFALVAILFIIFDLQIIFLLPWAVVFSKLTLEAKLAVEFFLLVLLVGFIYEWRKGALEW
jgi:NADH-quinone oxidoreductase subunit A